MKNWLICITGIIGAMSLMGTSSCNKTIETIDNNQVIETPYVLYFGDTSGALYNTNDGVKINKVPFPADGVPFKAICTSKANLLYCKMMPTLYFSYNSGVNFNVSYDSVRVHPTTAADGFPIDLNQTMICDIPKWRRIYVCSADPDPGNFLGLANSVSNGQWGSWSKEVYYNGGRVNLPIPFSITSLTFTKAGYLFGLDAIDHRTFYRTDTSTTALWNETTSNFLTAGTALPTTGWFSCGHYNNEIIAIDNAGLNGAYFSDDTGINFTQFSGLPANYPLLCVASPFEEICLIGTAGAGLYIMNVNTHAFQPCNNGLGNNLIVKGIAAKENIFKNGTLEKLVYIATNRGVYKSSDNGQNWVLIKAGNFTAIY